MNSRNVLDASMMKRRFSWWRASVTERVSLILKLAVIAGLILSAVAFLKDFIAAFVKGLDSTEQKVLFAFVGFAVTPITPVVANLVKEGAQNRQALVQLQYMRRPMITAIGNLLWRLNDRHGLQAFMPGNNDADEKTLLGISKREHCDELHSKEDYLVHDTVYRVAVVFYWMRRIREEFYIKGVLGPCAKEIEHADDALGWAFSESYRFSGRTALEVFAGQRDAIAVMMETSSDKLKQPIGYGEFRMRLRKEPEGEFQFWLGYLLEDVKKIISTARQNFEGTSEPQSDAWVTGSWQRIENITKCCKDLLDALATPAEIEQMRWLKRLLLASDEVGRTTSMAGDDTSLPVAPLDRQTTADAPSLRPGN